MTAAAIQTWRLGRRFRSTGTAGLAGIDLRVEPGTLVGVVGPNGAGKTTLLNLFATLVAPSAGRAEICGADLVEETALVRRLVGFAPDNARSFYGRLSAQNNLRVFGALYGLSGRLLRTRIDALIERFGVRSHADLPLQACSTGIRQRINLVRALLHDPPILLLDEPVQAIDTAGAESFVEFLAGEWRGRLKRTALLTAPRFEELPPVCDRVLLLSDGRLVEAGVPGVSRRGAG